MKALIAVLILSVPCVAQATPDLSIYGSLSRQQTVRNNLALRVHEVELAKYRSMRREIDRRMPPQTACMATSSYPRVRIYGRVTEVR